MVSNPVSNYCVGRLTIKELWQLIATCFALKTPHTNTYHAVMKTKEEEMKRYELMADTLCSQMTVCAIDFH